MEIKDEAGDADHAVEPAVIATVTQESPTRQTVEFQWEPGSLAVGEHKLYLHPTTQAQDVQRDADIQRAVLAERERICAAIKAEDDHCVTQGDYMLDSEDCIKVARGEWVRPVYEIGDAAIAASAAQKG